MMPWVSAVFFSSCLQLHLVVELDDLQWDFFLVNGAGLQQFGKTKGLVAR